MINVDASVKDQLTETLEKKIVNVIKNGAICEYSDINDCSIQKCFIDKLWIIIFLAYFY